MQDKSDLVEHQLQLTTMEEDLIAHLYDFFHSRTAEAPAHIKQLLMYGSKERKGKNEDLGVNSLDGEETYTYVEDRIASKEDIKDAVVLDNV